MPLRGRCVHHGGAMAVDAGIAVNFLLYSRVTNLEECQFSRFDLVRVCTASGWIVSIVRIVSNPGANQVGTVSRAGRNLHCIMEAGCIALTKEAVRLGARQR